MLIVGDKIIGELFFSMLKIFFALAYLDVFRDSVSRNLLVLAEEPAPNSLAAFLTDFSFSPSSQACPSMFEPDFS
jgi:hypothetical protein